MTVAYGVAGLKAAMTIAGFPESSPRLPLAPVNDDVMEELRGMLRHLESFTGRTLIGAAGQGDMSSVEATS